MSAPTTSRRDDGAEAGLPDVAGSYGRGVGAGAGAAALTSAAAIGLAWTLPLIGGTRSILFGAGLVGLSAAATLLVSATFFRVAPTATAPALAGLYLVKVLVFGWLLLVPGTPPWLVPAPFVSAVVLTLVGATVGAALIARRVTNREAAARPAPPAETAPTTAGKDQS